MPWKQSESQFKNNTKTTNDKGKKSITVGRAESLSYSREFVLTGFNRSLHPPYPNYETFWFSTVFCDPLA